MGGDEVKEPPESVYKIYVYGFLRESEAFVKFSKSKNESEACSGMSKWVPGLLNLAIIRWMAFTYMYPSEEVVLVSVGHRETELGRPTWALSKESVF